MAPARIRKASLSGALGSQHRQTAHFGSAAPRIVCAYLPCIGENLRLQHWRVYRRLRQSRRGMLRAPKLGVVASYGWFGRLLSAESWASVPIGRKVLLAGAGLAERPQAWRAGTCRKASWQAMKIWRNMAPAQGENNITRGYAGPILYIMCIYVGLADKENGVSCSCAAILSLPPVRECLEAERLSMNTVVCSFLQLYCIATFAATIVCL